MFKLIKAECLMLFGELKQYRMNYIFYNIGLLIMFTGIFFSFSESRDNSTNAALVLLYGLVLWQLCVSALTYLPNVIQDEAMMGTIEQISMTRTNFVSVLFSKVFVSATFDTLKAIILFIVCLFIFNASHLVYEAGLKNLIVLVIIVCTYACFYTFGLFFAGLALFFKRVQSIVQIVSYGLLFFTSITAPISQLPTVVQFFSAIIPLTWAVSLIEYVLSGNLSQRNLSTIIVGFILSSLAFVLIGIIGFKLFMKRAKQSGKLAHY